MTAKDFWKAYAGDTTVVSGKSAYKFSHDQEILDSSTRIEYSSSFSTYLFHYNKQTKVRDSQGNIPHVVYSGGVLILALDDGRKDYDGQLAGDDTQGMYEGTIRALIDEATILREIRDFANKSITYKCVDLKITSSQDVTRMKLGRFLGTGIWIEYTMLIRHDTYLVGVAPPVADVSFELILETSDFSTSNFTHEGVNNFTANVDGTADQAGLHIELPFTDPDNNDKLDLDTGLGSNNLSIVAVIFVADQAQNNIPSYFGNQTGINGNTGFLVKNNTGTLPLPLTLAVKNGATATQEVTGTQTFGRGEVVKVAITIDVASKVPILYTRKSSTTEVTTGSAYAGTANFDSGLDVWFMQSPNGGTTRDLAGNVMGFLIKEDVLTQTQIETAWSEIETNTINTLASPLFARRGTAAYTDEVDGAGAITVQTTGTTVFNGTFSDSRIYKAVTVSQDSTYLVSLKVQDVAGVGDIILSIDTGEAIYVTDPIAKWDLSDADFNSYQTLTTTFQTFDSTSATIIIKGDGSSEATEALLDLLRVYKLTFGD